MIDTSFIPSGFLKLRDAVDRTGQHIYGAAWTEREIHQLRDPPPKNPSDRLETTVKQLQSFLALGRIKAKAVAQNGMVFPVEPNIWLADYGRRVFDTGLYPIVNLLENLQARNRRTDRRRILVPEDELLAALKDIPIASRPKRTRRIEEDEDLEYRIKEVIRMAKEKWSDPHARPTFRNMAKELGRLYGHKLQFKAPTIDKILRGTYPPARRLNIKGL